jgi:hypothetical protein
VYPVSLLFPSFARRLKTGLRAERDSETETSVIMKSRLCPHYVYKN